jgi:hypothetical protein
VIQRHDDHDEAAQSIYGSYSGIRSHFTAILTVSPKVTRGEPAKSR